MKIVVVTAVSFVIGMFLAGCAGTMPASVEGECGIFHDPGRQVLGKTRADQRDIDVKWIEPGIASCGFKRPTK